MTKVFKWGVVVFVIMVVLIVGGLVLVNLFSNLEIPNLTSQRMDFGKAENSKEITEYYEIYTQKLDSEDFIDLKVNSFIDNLVKEFKNNNKNEKPLFNKDKAVLKQVIDTYKVNDDLMGVKITSIAKNLFEDNYSTSIYTYNFSKEDESLITLDELFDNRYKEVIPDGSYDNYLLTSDGIELYNKQYKSTIEYNTLLEYNASNKISAQNYQISQEEYDNMFKSNVDKNKKMVAITFDDGPHATNTLKILDILDRYDAKATFFMLGSNVINYQDVVKLVYERGNEIGIHTWNHNDLTKLSSDKILSEIDSTSTAIFNITGQRPKLVRPPYGAVNSVVKSTLCDYTLILWNIDSLDWKSRDENKIVPLVMNDVQDGDIILLHDIHATTVPAVEKIVKALDEADYQMVTVSELLDAKGYDTTSTKLFYSARQ